MRNILILAVVVVLGLLWWRRRSANRKKIHRGALQPRQPHPSRLPGAGFVAP